MSCACENKKLASELERIRRLGKAYAIMEECDVVIFKKEYGTYDFCKSGEQTKPIVEYISQY
jgi:hypothetical protein